MLLHYGVLDNSFQINGLHCDLAGTGSQSRGVEVRRWQWSSASKADNVVNNIEVLPPSPMDERIRRAVFHSIYSYGPMLVVCQHVRAAYPSS